VLYLYIDRGLEMWAGGVGGVSLRVGGVSLRISGMHTCMHMHGN
jgi:hypothetical protein